MQPTADLRLLVSKQESRLDKRARVHHRWLVAAILVLAQDRMQAKAKSPKSRDCRAGQKRPQSKKGRSTKLQVMLVTAHGVSIVWQREAEVNIIEAMVKRGSYPKLHSTMDLCREMRLNVCPSYAADTESLDIMLRHM